MKTFAAFMLGVLLTVAVFLSGLKTGVAQDPVTANPNMFKVLAEDERVRVIDDTVPAGAKVAMHSHPYRMKFTFPDGTTRVVDVEAGKARIAPPIVYAEENIGTTEAHALLVELKEPKK
jgi:hypothetical protein